MIISTEDFDKLVFNQRMGFECPTIQVQAALLVSGNIPDGGSIRCTKGLNGKLFMFRHMRAEVVTDSFHIKMFRKNFEGKGLLISFAEHEEANKHIIDHVLETYCGDMNPEILDDTMFKYRKGWLGVVDAFRRSHVEKIL